MTTRKQPFAGLRVVDFGWVWAGTVLGHILADYGAEVIKVESRRRLDGLRLGKVFELGTTLELNTFFHNLNRNKLSITLDISQPKSVELVKELVKKSSIVIENFTPNVLKRRGLDYESLTKIKPDIIMISMSAAGHGGPLSEIVTYAPIISALSGIDSLVGYPDSQPYGFKHAYCDPTASMVGAFALMVALRYHTRTGKGQHIDLSQWEVTTSLIGEAVMDFAMNGQVRGPEGNRHPTMAPHGNYPCSGDDKWVSIAVKTEKEWKALCKVLGGPSWSKDPKFATKHGRLTHAAELDGHLAQWTASHTDYAAAAILQQAGVAAAPVLSTDAVFLDPHFNERGVFNYVDHPVVGGEAVYDLPWKLGGVTRKPTKPAPTLGQHNAYVFGEILGLSGDAIKELEREEVIY